MSTPALNPRPSAASTHAPDLRVAPGRAYRVGQGEPARHRQGVHRREVDRDDGYALFHARGGDTHGRISYLSTKRLLGGKVAANGAGREGRRRHGRHPRRRRRHRAGLRSEAGAEVVVCARRPPEVPVARDRVRAAGRPRRRRRPDACAAVCPGWTSSSTTRAAAPTVRSIEADAERHARVVELNLARSADHLPRRARPPPARQGIDRHDRQRQRQPPLARHRRLRRRQGGPGEPRPLDGRGVGARHPGQHPRRGHGPHRAVPPPLRRPGRHRRRLAHRPARPPRRAVRHGRRRGVPRLRRAAYISGASLLVHGGGERPAFLDAATAGRAPADDKES